jgi:site-specific DNA-methyltransferase (adenine-specific)
MENKRNTLYYGDNLFTLREHIPTESVDLIYLDPPFNSNRSYNVLFQDEHGTDSEAQIKAFDDTWHWGEEVENTYAEILTEAQPHIAEMVESMREFIGSNQMMAYLVMMTARLIELHRVLKPTGSLYLHCDPTASHYLKVILDTIFNVKNFRNEIIWKRNFTKKGSQYAMNKFANNTDILLFYGKSEHAKFKTSKVRLPADEVMERYDKVDERGRRFKSEPLELPRMMARHRGRQPRRILRRCDARSLGGGKLGPLRTRCFHARGRQPGPQEPDHPLHPAQLRPQHLAVQQGQRRRRRLIAQRHESQPRPGI